MLCRSWWIWGWVREDHSLMSRRDCFQPAFAAAMEREGGGFLDLIEAFGGPAFEALLASIHALVRGAPGVRR